MSEVQATWIEALDSDPHLAVKNGSAKFFQELTSTSNAIGILKSQLRREDSVSVMKKCAISNNIQLFHHMTIIRGTLTDKTDRIVALQGWSNQTVPHQFE